MQKKRMKPIERKEYDPHTLKHRRARIHMNTDRVEVKKKNATRYK